MSNACCGTLRPNCRRRSRAAALAAVAAGILLPLACMPTDELPPTNPTPLPILRATITLDNTVPSITATDIDADGIDELIIGSPYDGDYPSSEAGVIRVLHGPIHDLDLSTAHLDLTLRGREPYRHFGSFLGIADLSNDGLPDVITRGATSLEGRRDIHVVSLTGEAEQVIEDASFLHVTGPHSLGDAMAVGDFNGDGAHDLAVGCSLRSQVYVLFGPREGEVILPDDADATFTATAGSLGAGVSAADVDGDGRTDLLTSDLDEDVIYLVAGADWSGEQPVGEAATTVIRVTQARGDLLGIKMFRALGTYPAILAVTTADPQSETLGTLHLVETPSAGEHDLDDLPGLRLTALTMSYGPAVNRIPPSSGLDLWAIGTQGKSHVPSSNLSGELLFVDAATQGTATADDLIAAGQARALSAPDAGVGWFAGGVLWSHATDADRRDLVVTGQNAVLVYELTQP